MASDFPLKDKLMNGMIKNGYSEAYAQRIFEQLKGFGSYGFPESHAVSFANLAYVSSWAKWKYPEVFACALLNSQPMGFYQPAQIIQDAIRHGVIVRPVDVNYSDWDNTLEEKEGVYFALRLGFRNINGLSPAEMESLLKSRKVFFKHMEEIINLGLTPTVMEKLANADAFRSLGLNRREALWRVMIRDRPLGLYESEAAEQGAELEVTLPSMSEAEQVVQDYTATSLTLRAHPVSFVREKLSQLYITETSALKNKTDGDLVKVAGLILVRQRPGTASGIVFITLEDETGTANLVVFAPIFEKYRKAIMGAQLLVVEGKLQIEGEVIHVVAERLHNFNRIFHQAMRPDTRPGSIDNVQQELFQKSRDFK